MYYDLYGPFFNYGILSHLLITIINKCTSKFQKYSLNNSHTECLLLICIASVLNQLPASLPSIDSHISGLPQTTSCHMTFRLENH